jgi:hypothetical protein
MVGVDFVIETFKLMRSEVINDDRQLMLTGLLEFLDGYIDFYTEMKVQPFSQHVVGLQSFLIFEIIDTSKLFGCGINFIVDSYFLDNGNQFQPKEKANAAKLVSEHRIWENKSKLTKFALMVRFF